MFWTQKFSFSADPVVLDLKLQLAETRHLKYMNFTDFYVWNKNLKTWTKSQEKESVGRMVLVSPNDEERYFIRLLLTHITGATSYD